MSGLGIIASTFFAWFSLGGEIAIFGGFGQEATGWDLFWNGVSGAGKTFVTTEFGLVFFTGFFSLVLGVLIALVSILILTRRRTGAVLAVVLGIAGLGIAAINLATIYTGFNLVVDESVYRGLSEITYTVNPGIGLWLFLGLSLLALIFGIIAASTIRR